MVARLSVCGLCRMKCENVMFPETWSAATVFALFIAISIVAFYANNVRTGWKICYLYRYHLPDGKIRLVAFWYMLLFFIWKFSWIDVRPAEEKAKVSRALTFFSPYMSLVGSLLGALTHLVWFLQGHWHNQFGLFGFFLLHNIMSTFTHATHLKIFLNRKD